MAKPNTRKPADGSGRPKLDYKSAILKGIKEIQATAGSEDIRADWELIKQAVEKQTDPTRVALMYRVLMEEISKARGVEAHKFRVRMPNGRVVDCSSVEELMGWG